jgi:hypothetical protein
MNRAFVLGAGASRFAGYPLGLDLWRFLRDTDLPEVHTREARAAVLEVMEPILRLNPPPERDRPDLEKLFTLLDLGRLGVGPEELRRADWPLTKEKVMRLIAADFQWQEQMFQGQIVYANYPFGLEIDQAFAQSVLTAWVDTLNPGDSIVSFNWDLLHESALWRGGKWHFADGYGFRCRDSPEDVRSPIKFLKLHGSVNWAQESPLDVVAEVEHKQDYFKGATDDRQTYSKRAGRWNMGRNLIVPSYMKDISGNRLLLRLWNQARIALREADEIFVIGFSLNDADVAARELFATALDQKDPAPRLVVIAPEQYQWDMFCRYNLRIKQERIRMRFEDWITSKPLSRD